MSIQITIDRHVCYRNAEATQHFNSTRLPEVMESYTVFTYCVLTVMSWIRSRLRNNEIPKELHQPEPDGYASVSPDTFISFESNQGYKLEVISIPDEHIWALRLTEPDISCDNDKDSHTPVPGRIIDTNIAFALKGDTVKCAFRTVISEPEDV